MVPASEMSMPSFPLPETMLRAPATVPPIVSALAEPKMATPRPVLPNGLVPLTSVPM